MTGELSSWYEDWSVMPTHARVAPYKSKEKQEWNFFLQTLRLGEIDL
jgi:hypothetical protein